MTFKPFPWQLYSKKIIQKLENPRNAGHFTEEETHKRGLRWVFGQAGDKADGNFIKFYIMVDREDGSIVDAKYQAFGQTALIAAAEFGCDLVVGKNYDQARRVSADLIEKEATDKKGLSFPKETYPHLNLIIDALEEAADKCMDIPLPKTYLAPPTPKDIEGVREGGIPDWEKLSIQEQLQIIDQVLDQDIRPYIALDAGGVEVLNLLDGHHVIISYQGSCTSCYSSSGATLSYIQQVLKAKVHPSIEVTPDTDFT